MLSTLLPNLRFKATGTSSNKQVLRLKLLQVALHSEKHRLKVTQESEASGGLSFLNLCVIPSQQMIQWVVAKASPLWTCDDICIALHKMMQFEGSQLGQMSLYHHLCTVSGLGQLQDGAI